MKREDVNRALAACESVTEAVGVWWIGLPPPFTFLLAVAYTATAIGLGAWMAS